MKEGGSKVSSCLKRRSERPWRGRLYGPAPGSLRGGFPLGKRRRSAGKCDNLSYLRVCLLQMGEVLGGTNGRALGGVSLICSGALSAGQAVSTVRLVFGALVNGAYQRIDRGQKGDWVVTKRHITDKIRQKVVETFRISGDDESRKGRPIFGYFTFWYIGILFFWYIGIPFFLWLFTVMIARPGIGDWYVANILEVYLEPFCLGGGLFVVAAIGLIVDFVFVVRDWKRGRQRKEK